MEIVYKSRLVAKKNAGEKLCTLTEDEKFQITSELDGEGGALTDVYKRQVCQRADLSSVSVWVYR